MKTIADYLDEVKEKHKIKSDSELSRQLGGSRNAVSNWRQGLNKPDDYACIRMAELLGVNPLEIIAASHIEREADPERAKWWADFSKRHGIKVLSVSLIGTSLAFQYSNLALLHSVPSLYIMLSRIRVKERKKRCNRVYISRHNAAFFTS